MTPDELGKLLAMPKEGAALEFKEAKSQFDIDTFYRHCVFRRESVSPGRSGR